MAVTYQRLLFSHKSLDANHYGYKNNSAQYRTRIINNQESDRNFYEALIKLLMKTMAYVFDKASLSRVESEVNRLFRGTTFNIVQRNHDYEKRLKRYPQLKDFPQKDPDKLIEQLKARLLVPK